VIPIAIRMEGDTGTGLSTQTAEPPDSPAEEPITNC